MRCLSLPLVNPVAGEMSLHNTSFRTVATCRFNYGCILLLEENRLSVIYNVNLDSSVFGIR